MGLHIKALSQVPIAIIVGIVLLGASASSAQTKQQFEAARKKMVEEVVVGNGVKDKRVTSAMESTPRHEFVDRKLRTKAYLDMALPIGEGQTISSPFMVAFMTEAIDPKKTDRVLEVGTGSGYQAAVLSPLVKDVYSVEIVPELGRQAARTLKRLRYNNVYTKVGDGYQGWPDKAPFDKIIVTCSPEKVPVPLVQQLREGGRMVIPVGRRYQQTLYQFRKENGKLVAEALRPTLFVPMTGKAESTRKIKPDPANPKLVNGFFEEKPDKSGTVPGWYYQRQVEVVYDKLAPEGVQYMRFTNKDRGRSSSALQGFAVDGRKVTKLQVSAWISVKDILPGLEIDELPMIAVLFYDERRRELGHYWLGPWRADEEWHKVTDVFRVPVRAREAIIHVGMFGATGEFSVDRLSIVGQ